MAEDKKWLIKSNDIILGPLEFNHVVENLFKGDIHVLDEIKGPFDRWCHIKDNSLFTAALEKLKSTHYNRREQTVTATVDINTTTQEITTTQTKTSNQQEENQQEDGEFVLEEKVGDKKEDKKESIEEENRRTRLSSDLLLPSKNRKNFFTTLSIIGVLSLAIIFYWYGELKKARKIEENNIAYSRSTDRALKAMKIGDYRTALKNFNRAYRLSPKDPNLFIEMAPLAVQFEGQFSQVQGKLEQFMMNSRDKSFLNYGRNVIGLTHSYRNRHDEALHFYNQIVQVDEKFLPAIVNKTFSLLKLNRPEEAVAFIEKRVKNFQEEPIIYYLYIRSLIETGLKKNKKESLKKAFLLGQQFSKKFLEFKQEVLFLISLGKMHLNKGRQDWIKSIEDFLKVDIELTHLHIQNPHVDFQSFNWLDYSSHCKEMQKNIKDVYLSELLKGFCLLKINHVPEGKRIFEKLLASQNHRGLSQALYASALFKLGDKDRAKNVLNFVSQVDQKQIVTEVVLRGCLMAGDIHYAGKIIEKGSKNPMSMLYSHWGYGAVFFEKDPEKAKISIQLGLEISPHFIPLLRLKNRKNSSI